MLGAPADDVDAIDATPALNLRVVKKWGRHRFPDEGRRLLNRHPGQGRSSETKHIALVA